MSSSFLITLVTTHPHIDWGESDKVVPGNYVVTGTLSRGTIDSAQLMLADGTVIDAAVDQTGLTFQLSTLIPEESSPLTTEELSMAAPEVDGESVPYLEVVVSDEFGNSGVRTMIPGEAPAYDPGVAGGASHGVFMAGPIFSESQQRFKGRTALLSPALRSDEFHFSATVSAVRSSEQVFAGKARATRQTEMLFSATRLSAPRQAAIMREDDELLMLMS